MNYEDAFRHYREGTATDEEKAFVLDEIAKAKALSSLLDDEGLAVKPAPIKEAEAKDVKDAKHRMIMRRVLGGLIAVVVIIIALGAILGGVFGSAAAYARDNVVLERTEAITVAEDYAREHAEKNGFVVSHAFSDLPRDVDEDFNFVGDRGSIKTDFSSAEEAVEAFGGVCADVGVGGEGVQGHGVEVEGTEGLRGDVEPVGQSPEAGGVHAADVQELGDVGVEAQALAVGQDLAGVVGADAGEGVQGGAVGGVEFDTVPAPAVVGV